MKLQILKNVLFENSQDVMAAALEISQPNISRILRGTLQIPSVAISRLVDKYNIDANWLLSDDENPVIQFQDDKVSKAVYIQVLEENNMLKEKFIAYQKSQIDTLKNIENISDTA